MTDAAFWISYGLPAFGVAFGLVGLAVAWIASRRFDARFPATEKHARSAARNLRVSPYRRPSKPQHGKPGRALPARP